MCDIMDGLYPSMPKTKEIVYVTFDISDLEAIRELDYFDDADDYSPEDGPPDACEYGCIETANYIVKFIGQLND